MFKWMNQFHIIKSELTELLAAKSSKDFEVKLETMLETLSNNPHLLNTLSLILNTQSQLKSFVNFGFEKLWKNIQLPNKKDQERTLYMLHELQFKLHQMEKEFLRLKNSSFMPSSSATNTSSRQITILDKRKTDQSISKTV